MPLPGKDARRKINLEINKGKEAQDSSKEASRRTFPKAPEITPKRTSKKAAGEASGKTLKETSKRTKKEKKENVYEKYIKVPKLEEQVTESGEVRLVPSIELKDTRVPRGDILKWLGR